MLSNRNELGMIKISRLSSFIDNKHDLFILFRLIAAILVLFAHSYHIFSLNADPLTSKVGIYTGTLAVYVFFVISGFFIMKSAIEKNVVEYFLARLCRIYPALIFCNLITVFVLIPMALNVEWSTFVTSIEVRDYLKINSILDSLKFTISGVFDQNPDKAINGSLWTLPIEIRSYFISLLIVMSGLATKRSIFNAFLFIVIFMYYKFPDFYVSIFPIPNSITLIFFFLLGAAIFINRQIIPISPIFSILVAIIVYKYRLAWQSLIVSILFSYVVVSSAYAFGRIFDLNLKCDYSYGCYLYAYPVSQVCYIFLEKFGFYYYLFSIFVVTGFLSFISWHLVESKINRFVRTQIFPKIKNYSIFEK